MKNLNKFMEVYEKNLHKAVEQCPQDYAYMAGNVKVVANRMKEAIARGTYNKEGKALQMTCKELGIKHTYRAINDYLKGGGTKYHDNGVPIVSLEKKLEYLNSCFKEKAYEDCAGHLCDLLELCRRKIRNSQEMMFSDLRGMVGHYGTNPTPIEE